MESLLIKPRDKKELAYLIELMENIGSLYNLVPEDATEEFEMAMMIKNKTINTAGIMRKDMERTDLSMHEQLMLTRSEQDIKERLIITERKIQHEEDEWISSL
ncbi:hypothetical protein [Reichenbachiella versicolor]|uniref:hypothetical protein n=1 Tax=Reichenbachiella versicolor TaxID=1821036 RepID=UPI000D6E05C5|nr:hypothetical protein [Reichenbachiella versicolor]